MGRSMEKVGDWKVGDICSRDDEGSIMQDEIREVGGGPTTEGLAGMLRSYHFKERNITVSSYKISIWEDLFGSSEENEPEENRNEWRETCQVSIEVVPIWDNGSMDWSDADGVGKKWIHSRAIQEIKWMGASDCLDELGETQKLTQP